MRTSFKTAALLAASVLVLTGCAAADATPSKATAADSVTIDDAWVKAADSGMTAAFGILGNDGADDVTIVSATTDAAEMTELHETVKSDTGEMTMREVDGGFVVPAGGDFTLEPGSNHLMLMGVTDPLEAGEEVTVTLTFADDSTYEFTAPVKDYTGAEENYDGGE